MLAGTVQWGTVKRKKVLVSLLYYFSKKGLGHQREQQRQQQQHLQNLVALETFYNLGARNDAKLSRSRLPWYFSCKQKEVSA